MALTRPLLSQLNTNIIAFSDNLMVINAGNVANRDLGIVFDRSVNSQSNVALFWQESSSSFTFAQTTSSGLNNANIVVGLTSNVVLGNIILAGEGTAGIFYANGSAWGGGGGGTPGGDSGQIQYNNLGAFAGATGATFSGTNLSVTGFNVNSSATIGTTLGVTGNITGSGLTLSGSARITNSLDADGGLQSTPIGNATPSSAAFTTIAASGTFTGVTINAATIGNTGAALTGATVNAATIGNTGSLITGTLQTAAQTNITSVGTLTTLGVSGNITASVIASTNNGSGTNFKVGDDSWIGDINVANTFRITGQQTGLNGYIVFGNSNTQSLGRAGTGALTYQGGFTAQGGLQSTPIGNATPSSAAFTTIAASGTFTGVTINAATIGNTGAALTGTLQTAAQTNITSVGNIAAAGMTSSARVAPNANATVDLGATGLRWNNVYGVTFSGVSTTAKYADLAEIYTTDENYAPGTVVVFGGPNEITVTSIAHDTRVAGVISTNPAYLMNSETVGLPVALTGRVPCLVQGPVSKGDVLVTSVTTGAAQKINAARFQPGCVIGKALENILDSELKIIEVVVGRF